MCTMCVMCGTLQVLSGKLMPPTETIDDTSQIFRRNFLEAGGLKYIINILRSHSFSSSISVDIRQDCYAIALLLAKFLLCATPTKTEDMVEVMEEQPPANPPSTLRQMSKSTSITVEDEVARLTIEVWCYEIMIASIYVHVHVHVHMHVL